MFIFLQISDPFLKMSKLSLRVKCQTGSGVVRGLDPLDSLEKLVTHSLECLGLDIHSNRDSIKMLTGFPPKSVDLADMDLSIVSAGIKSGDTLIFEIVKKG